jgi:hypothetical protein
MALPATDNFSTQTVDTSLAGSWTILCGTMTAVNAGDLGYASETTEECAAYWNADSFDAAQYSQAVCDATSATTGGVAVRCSETDNFYGFYLTNSQSYLFKMVNASWTQLGNTGGGATTTRTYRLEITGVNPGTLTAKENGSTFTGVGTSGVASDSDLDSGSAGVCGYGSTTTSRFDDWEGGNLGGGAATVLKGPGTYRGMFRGMNRHVA